MTTGQQVIGKLRQFQIVGQLIGKQQWEQLFFSLPVMMETYIGPAIQDLHSQSVCGNSISAEMMVGMYLRLPEFCQSQREIIGLQSGFDLFYEVAVYTIII